MALLKTIKTHFGVDATYWQITAVAVDYKASTIRVQLTGWHDEASRHMDGGAPLTAVPVDIGGDPFKADPTRADLYALIKTGKGFEGAADVIEGPSRITLE